MSITINMVRNGYMVEGEFFHTLSSAIKGAKRIASECTELTGVIHNVAHDMGVF